jgi:hypothetical protein
VDKWVLWLSVSLVSALMFVFGTTAIVAQFGDIARFPGWSRACVLPRAGTIGGRVRDSLTSAVITPLSPLLAVAVIGDGSRLQNPVVVTLGLVALVAIVGWCVFLFRSLKRSRVVE